MTFSPASNNLAINRFQTQKTVRMVDTDASGIVHIAALIRMMEETEYAFLRSRGLSVVLKDGRGLMGFPRLSTSIEIEQPVGFDAELVVEIFLMEVNGKTIDYSFLITQENGTNVAKAKFCVAVCRFPPDDPPYAILTPDFVIESLTRPGAIISDF